jgi:hypothetical protein
MVKNDHISNKDTFVPDFDDFDPLFWRRLKSFSCKSLRKWKFPSKKEIKIL